MNHTRLPKEVLLQDWARRAYQVQRAIVCKVCDLTRWWPFMPKYVAENKTQQMVALTGFTVIRIAQEHNGDKLS